MRLNKSMNHEQWVKILNESINEPPNDRQREHMVCHADNWMTCAVGAKLMCDLNLDTLKTLSGVDTYVNSNIDKNILDMGQLFFPKRVRNQDYKGALEILETIYNTKNIHKSWLTKVKFRFSQRIS